MASDYNAALTCISLSFLRAVFYNGEYRRRSHYIQGTPPMGGIARYETYNAALGVYVYAR